MKIVAISLMLLSSLALADTQVDYTCTQPATRTDGSELLQSEIQGYIFRLYADDIVIDQNDTTSCATQFITDSTEALSVDVAAMDTNGQLGDFSERSYVIAPPSPPTDLEYTVIYNINIQIGQ